MTKRTNPRQEKASSRDRNIERLRQQLTTLKPFLVTEPSSSTLAEFDIATEELISEVFGSASPMVDAYEYAQLGEATGMVNLAGEAPESVAHATERESLKQRQRILEICLGDLQTRRAAIGKGGRAQESHRSACGGLHFKASQVYSSGCNLKGAGQQLKELKVGSLLVKGGDEYLGSITETELTHEVVAGGVDPTTTVKTCMREPIITVESSDSIIEAIRLMDEGKGNSSFGRD